MKTGRKIGYIAIFSLLTAGFTIGQSEPVQEPPKCGDDAYEYLTEELGQSPNGGYREGPLACVTHPRDCVLINSGDIQGYSKGVYVDTDSVGEKHGRLKKDKEVCVKIDEFPVSAWIDQDFNKTVCKTNTLYGTEGRRWIEPNYIERYPGAVTGGIDDDAGEGLTSKGLDKYTSTQGSINDLDPGETPVPTGKNVEYNVEDLNQDRVATKGFCAGDDQSEYLIVQRCKTDMCKTQNSVLGAATHPDSCILDGSNYNLVDNSKEVRKLYREGEQVRIDYGKSTRKMGCFGGIWFEKWPVSFQEDSVKVKKGDSYIASFQIINVREEEKTFEVELEGEDKITPFAEFVSFEGDKFETVVPAKSSKEFNLKIYGGGPASIDTAQLRVQATSKDRTLDGEDSVSVDILEQDYQQQTQSKQIPGIGAIQVAVISIISSAIVFLMA